MITIFFISSFFFFFLVVPLFLVLLVLPIIVLILSCQWLKFFNMIMTHEPMLIYQMGVRVW